jgi:hypothetical protein
MNIDDYGVDPAQTFPQSYSAGIRDALHSGLASGGPIVKFIPTVYYDTNNGGSTKAPSTRFVLEHYPWINDVTDGVLFYFQNRKGGQDVCKSSPLCGSNPSQSYWACLWDSCAEASLVHGLPDEIADFAAAMPAGNELHVGLYFDGYGSGPTRATPSVKYARDALEAVLGVPAVSGTTVYTFQKPTGPCPNKADRGCAVQEIFKNHSRVQV